MLCRWLTVLHHWLIILHWHTHRLQALHYLWNMAKVCIELLMHLLLGQMEHYLHKWYMLEYWLYGVHQLEIFGVGSAAVKKRNEEFC